MANDLLEAIKSRKYFYRDSYHRACTALWIALIIILGLSLFILYFYMQRPLPVFYATSTNGKVTPLIPLDAPNYSHTPLIQ